MWIFFMLRPSFAIRSSYGGPLYEGNLRWSTPNSGGVHPLRQ
jgi:hypothetical protein